MAPRENAAPAHLCAGQLLAENTLCLNCVPNCLSPTLQQQNGALKNILLQFFTVTAGRRVIMYVGSSAEFYQHNWNGKKVPFNCSQ